MTSFGGDAVASVATPEPLGFAVTYDRLETPGSFTLGMVRTGDDAWASGSDAAVKVRLGYRLKF